MPHVQAPLLWPFSPPPLVLPSSAPQPPQLDIIPSPLEPLSPPNPNALRSFGPPLTSLSPLSSTSTLPRAQPPFPGPHPWSFAWPPSPQSPSSLPPGPPPSAPFTLLPPTAAAPPPSPPTPRRPGSQKPPSGPRNLMPVTVGSCSRFWRKAAAAPRETGVGRSFVAAGFVPRAGGGRACVRQTTATPTAGRPSASPASVREGCVGRGASLLNRALGTLVRPLLRGPTSSPPPSARHTLQTRPSMAISSLFRSQLPDSLTWWECTCSTAALHP